MMRVKRPTANTVRSDSGACSALWIAVLLVGLTGVGAHSPAVDASVRGAPDESRFRPTRLVPRAQAEIIPIARLLQQLGAGFSRYGLHGVLARGGIVLDPTTPMHLVRRVAYVLPDGFEIQVSIGDAAHGEHGILTDIRREYGISREQGPRGLKVIGEPVYFFSLRKSGVDKPRPVGFSLPRGAVPFSSILIKRSPIPVADRRPAETKSAASDHHGRAAIQVAMPHSSALEHKVAGIQAPPHPARMSDEARATPSAIAPAPRGSLPGRRTPRDVSADNDINSPATHAAYRRRPRQAAARASGDRSRVRRDAVRIERRRAPAHAVQRQVVKQSAPIPSVPPGPIARPEPEVRSTAGALPIAQELTAGSSPGSSLPLASVLALLTACAVVWLGWRQRARTHCSHSLAPAINQHDRRRAERLLLLDEFSKVISTLERRGTMDGLSRAKRSIDLERRAL